MGRRKQNATAGPPSKPLPGPRRARVQSSARPAARLILVLAAGQDMYVPEKIFDERKKKQGGQQDGDTVEGVSVLLCIC